MKRMILLTYFDNKFGPRIYFSYPKQMVDVTITDLICRLIDLDIEDGCIVLIKGVYRIFNFPFSIPSQLARGNREMLCLSFLFQEDHHPLNETKCKLAFKLFKEKLENNPNIYQAFHPSSEQCFFEKEYIENIIRKLHRGIDS